MNEFVSSTGGRYVYADDLINLQELALSLSKIFDNCDNFIICGCKPEGTNITPGYVYLNGKIRYFAGASGVTSWPRYIYEDNRTININYVTGGEKAGRESWGCKLGTVVPSGNAGLTGRPAQSIAVNSNGGLTMKNAFFGKYALLHSEATSQSVSGPINFTGTVNFTGKTIMNRNGLDIISNGNEGNISYDGNALVITSKSNTARINRIVFDDAGLKFFVGSVQTLWLGSSGIRTALPIICSQGNFGGTIVASNDIYQGTNASDTGTLSVNMVGYNGSSSYFRNTVIGDGKSHAILTVAGATKDVLVEGTTTLRSTDENFLVLRSQLNVTNNTLRSAISWKDASGIVMGRVGFTSTQDNNFYLTSEKSAIIINGIGYVDIGPEIKENGTSLSAKYVPRAIYQREIAQKANVNNVYDRTEANSTFSTLDGGLFQFIRGDNTQEMLRAQIGAAPLSEMSSYPLKSQLLADMATTNEEKRSLCNNIGAAIASETESLQYDSGWDHVFEANGMITNKKIWIRQKGDVVYIEGEIGNYTNNGDTIFIITPNLRINRPPRTIYAKTTESDMVISLDEHGVCRVVSAGLPRSGHILMSYII